MKQRLESGRALWPRYICGAATAAAAAASPPPPLLHAPTSETDPAAPPSFHWPQARRSLHQGGNVLAGAPAPAPAVFAPAPAPAEVAGAAGSPPPPAGLTAAEVASHNTEGDCWWVGAGGLQGANVRIRAEARRPSWHVLPLTRPLLPDLTTHLACGTPCDHHPRYIYQASVYDLTPYLAAQLHPGAPAHRTASARALHQPAATRSSPPAPLPLLLQPATARLCSTAAPTPPPPLSARTVAGRRRWIKRSTCSARWRRDGDPAPSHARQHPPRDPEAPAPPGLWWAERFFTHMAHVF